MMTGLDAGLVTFLLYLCVTTSGAVDTFDLCARWPGSHYANAKCLKVVAVSNDTNATPQEECQGTFPRGELAVVEGLEELTVLREESEMMALSKVVFRLADDSLAESDCDVTCDPADDHCVACVVYFRDPSLCSNCLNESSVTHVLCQQTVGNPCDTFLPGGVFWKGHCFQVWNASVTWVVAQEACQGQQAFLAEGITRQLMERIRRLVKNASYSLWTGGTNDFEDGTFRWQTSGLNVFTNGSFSTLMGNVTSLGLTTVNRTDGPFAILASDLLDFVAVPANTTSGYLCQRDIGDPCEHTFTGGVFADGYCLQFYNQRRTFDTAVEFCVRAGGQLVQPWTEELQVSVISLVPNNTGPWIGAFKRPFLNAIFRSQHDHRPVGDIIWDPNHQPDSDMHYLYLAFSTTSPGTFVALNESREREVVCQTDVREPTSSYLIPLDFVLSWSTSARLLATTSLRTVRVYVRIQTSVEQDLALANFTLLTFDQPLDLDLDNDLPSSPLLLITTSHPATFQLFVTRGSTSQSSALILPFTRPYFGGSYQNRIFLSVTHTNDTEISLIPTREDGTTFDLVMESNGKRPMFFDGMNFSVDHGVFETTLEQFDELRLLNQPEHGTVLVDSSHVITIFLVHLMPSPLGDSGFNLMQLAASPPPSTWFLTLPCFQPFCDVSCPGNELWVSSPTGQSNQYCKASAVDNTIRLEGENFWTMAAGSHSEHVQLYEASSAWQLLAPCATGSERTTCRLIPFEFWRHEYSFHLPPEAWRQEVHVVLFMHTNVTGRITLNGQALAGLVTCTTVEGTQYASCTGNMTSTLTEMAGNDQSVYFLELDLGDEPNLDLRWAERFGAYLMIWTGNDLSCHPLGMTDIMIRDPRWTGPAKEFAVQDCQWIDNSNNNGSNPDGEGERETTTTAAPESTPEDTTANVHACTCESATTATIDLPTEDENVIIIKNIRRSLKVNVRETSASIRKLTSAVDNRPSSKTIGALGIILVSFTIGFIVIPDFMTVVQFVSTHWH